MIEKQELRKESLLLWIYIAVVLFHLITPKIYGFEGRPWIDENGNVTDLININPDPNGEPWIVGGLKPLTDEQQRFMENTPELSTTRNLMERTLPEEVILIENDEFPPIMQQVGASCGMASGIGYSYSYQWNVIKGGNGESPSDNRAYGFTWNFLNDGKRDKGAWFWKGWDILSKVGAPSVTTFYKSNDGGLNCTRYMSGADRWHKSNNNRALSYNKIRISTMADIKRIKNWMYDLNGTDPHKKGGCVNFALKGGSLKKTREVTSGPHAGDPICDSISGVQMDHAATFAGYSDNVAGGAFLLVNSWGEDWMGKGYAWVPYSRLLKKGLYEDYVWCVTVGKVKPVFELRATITHKERNNLKLNAGFANGETSTPTVTKNYNQAFNFTGGRIPMPGVISTGNSTIEISLDASEFFENLHSNDATFFLDVVNKSGDCTIENLTLIDYSSSTPAEFAAVQTKVSISGDKSVLIPISYKAKVPHIFITATSHGKGTISPKGVSKVFSGEELNYTMTPDIWHRVDSIVVDGINVGNKPTYTFTNVTSDHTIDVYFGWDPDSPDIYTIKSTTNWQGKISPSDSIVTTEGSDTGVTIKPTKWYHVDSVLVDGKNLGPLVSAQFTYLTANHTIEPFYGTKDYGEKSSLWSSTMQYAMGTIIRYNGHLWKANWWTTNEKPGGGSGAWEDLGEYLKPEDDTLTIAFLNYISNPQRVDTLIITTKRIFKGDTTTVVDTITDQVAKDFTQKTSNRVHGYFLPSGSQFYAPQKGVYTVTLFDLRGRLIKQVKVNAHTSGINKIPVNTSSISNGTYLMQLSGKNTNLIRKFIF